MEKLIIEGAGLLSVGITPEMAQKLQRFAEMIKEKNKVMNLTSITEDREIVIKHFLDSLTPLAHCGIESGVKAVDLGTGAGLPGLPLCIARPDASFCLMDSTRKKLTFVDEVISALCITNAYTLHMRAEDAGKSETYAESFDLCVSRAVAPLDKLAGFAMPLLKRGGVFIAYKGPNCTGEIEALKAQKGFCGEIEKVETVTLPFSDVTHTLVITRKVRQISHKPGKKRWKAI